MAEFRWIKTLLFIMLVTEFTDAVKGELLSITVMDGGEVILPCKNVIDDQDKCDSTTWIYSDSGTAVALFEHGKIQNNTKPKSDRLSVTENCSLVIKNVTDEDVGLYTCRQFDKLGKQHDGDSQVDLSVDTSDNTTTTTTAKSTTENTTTAGTTTTVTAKALSKQALLRLTIVIVCLAALTVIVVAVKKYKRRKGKKTQNENTGLSLNPAETQSGPETSQDTDDPEDGVSYASISFTKKNNSKAQVHNKHEDDDEGDAVTYSTVKASSSSAGASTDPSDLYATVNKPNK